MDIGTGDGSFVYRSALSDPSRLFIGIDANPKFLRKISIKADRKLGRSGSPNALFAQAAAEDLPSEFDGLISGIHINFPWGSLLRSTLLPEPSFAARLLELLRPGGSLSIVSGLDPSKDIAEMKRLGLPHFDKERLEESVLPRYRAAGFTVERSGSLSPDELSRLGSSWARRLRSSGSREIFRLDLSRK